ncbi:MAG: cell division protein FtsQ/DivIB [Candidatus Shapirobacteria bacterium]|nr:cell division protein FtsQ/DivIB [Candidatus Shapirobacteria bacterium]
MNWKSWFKLLFFFILLGFLFFWLKSNFWQVKKVSCHLDNQDCPIELFNKATEISLRKNLIFFPKKLVIEEIKNFYPQINDIKIKKIIFNSLVFELSSRKIIAALAVELVLDENATSSAESKNQEISLDNNFYLIDKDGVVLEKTDQQANLPLIIIQKNPNLDIGQRFNQDGIEKIMEIISGLKINLIEFNIVHLISSQEIEVWLKNKTLVLFNGEKEINFQLDSLQLIFSRAKIEGKEIKKIDLRFDKPVIN